MVRPVGGKVEAPVSANDQGTRVVDAAPPGQGNSIGNVAFGVDSLTLGWTHRGAQRQLQLR